jgi:hypothetical protein
MLESASAARAWLLLVFAIILLSYAAQQIDSQVLHLTSFPLRTPFIFPTPPANSTWEEVVQFRYWDGGVPRPCTGAPLAALAAAAAALPAACTPGSATAWRGWLTAALSADCQYVGAPASRRVFFSAPPANATVLLLFAVGAGAPVGEAPARAALRAALARWSLARWHAQFRGRLEVQLLVAGEEGGLPRGALAALVASGGAHGAVVGLAAAGGPWGAWQEGVAGVTHRLGALPWVVLASDGAVGPLTWFPELLDAVGDGTDDAPPAAFYASSAAGACCGGGAQVLAFSGAASARPLWREFFQKLPAAAAAPGCGSPLPLLPRGVAPAHAAAAAEQWAFCVTSEVRAPLGAHSSLAELRATSVPFYPVGALGEEFGEDADAAVAYVKALWFGTVLEPCGGGGGLPEAADDVGV